MIKKLFSFICCLAPMGAVATPVFLEPNYGGVSVDLTQGEYANTYQTGLVVNPVITGQPDPDSIIIRNPTGGSATTKNLILNDAGMNVANLVVGEFDSTKQNGFGHGILYIVGDTESAGTGFYISSPGNISIGSLLWVLDGNTITIAGANASTGRVNFTLGNVTQGSDVSGATQNNGILNLGTLKLENIAKFDASSAISNYGDELSIDANEISGTSLNTTKGNVTLTANNGPITMSGDVTSDGTAVSTKFTANAMNVNGELQNNSGEMIIALATGDLTVGKSLENKSGDLLKINAGDIVVNGAATNEHGTMVINAQNLTISGKNTSNNHLYNDASFVNKGDLYIDVSGATTLKNGFDVSAMDPSKTFSLKTGTLDFGDDPLNWQRLFTNKLYNFVVHLRNGDIELTNADIINMAGGNMQITANNVTAKSIQNNGNNLDIAIPGDTADGTPSPITGSITVSGGISNSGNANILAGDRLSATAVNNETGATMHLGGENGVTLDSITNNGQLLVQSSNATVGNINITGNVTNESGTTSIESRQIKIGGTLSANGGTINITGSDQDSASLKLAKVNVTDGILNINSLKGGVTVDDDLTVLGTAGTGAMNIGQSVTKFHVVGDTLIGGNITLGAATATSGNNVNIGGLGTQTIAFDTTGTFTANGIGALNNDYGRTATFTATEFQIGNGGIAAANLGNLIFGNNDTITPNRPNVTTTGAITANQGGTIEFFGDQVTAASVSGDGKIKPHGTILSATNGDINIGGKVWLDGNDHASGLVIADANTFTMTTAAPNTTGGSITTNDVVIAGGRTLNVASAHDVTINGTITGGNNLPMNGTLDINATAGTAKVTNGTTIGQNAILKVNAADINMADLTNSNETTLTAANRIITGRVNNTAGTLDVTGQSLSGTSLATASGAVTNWNVEDTELSGPVTVGGDMIQGANTGTLNIASNAQTFSGGSLNVSGKFDAIGGNTKYTFDGPATIGGNINISTGAGTDITASAITAQNVTNYGTLALFGKGGITLNNGNGTVENHGDLTLNSGTGISKVASFISSGTATLGGAGLTTGTPFNQNTLYQNYRGNLSERDVNIASNKYEITTSNVILDAIKQYSGNLTFNTNDVQITNSIEANGVIRFAGATDTWLTVGVNGDVSANTQFINLEHMEIGGNYTFNNTSSIYAAILPYATGTGSSIYNYWADVSLANDNTLGQIKNRENAEPLISVGGQFITNLDIDIHHPDLAAGNPVHTDQFGIKIFDMIDQGTAIWLLHADEGIQELATKIRNLNVQFCNGDGTLCFDYYKTTEDYNKTGTDLPAYLSTRDTDGDGTADSVYVVFDPRFGGPLALFKIQPIVERVPGHTKGEYVSAGALDDLIEGQLLKAKFTNKTPIDAIPVAFRGTNMEELATQLYNRMDYYDITRDGTGLARFSRLTQAREIEQMAGSVVMNEHTSFRDFEDRMLDEFIWHRNRSLRKAWGDFDFGLFNQKADDGKRIDGNRFSFTGGYDWQESQTLILGLTGRISHTSGENDDHIELGYRPGEHIAGHVKTDVADTNFGIGAYLMKTLGTKMRGYGNAFLDLHWLDVSRKQNYVGKIEGDGTAFSLISEWGLMHDWLNQYIVGNLYARAGYNTGFSVTEKVHGHDYMKLESDGYFILTPGYTLTAQKRIYPSAWFQIRPYASVGVEYDVFGAPDNAKYKFAPANRYTKYSIDIDPLWANIGGGLEFLSSTGIQVGLDYRYQYNADIQLHKIKISGSYRF